MKAKKGLTIVFWTFLVLFFILIEFVVIYYSFSPPSFSKNLEGDPPHVLWLHVRTGKWSRHVLKSFNQEELQDAYPVSVFSIDPEIIYDEFGKRGLFVLMSEVVEIRERGVSSKPYHVAGFAQTSIDGEDYLVVAQIWKNKTGRAGMVTYLFPSTNDSLTLIREATQPNSDFFLRPVMYFKDQNSCESHHYSGNNLCQYIQKQTITRKAIVYWWEYFDNIPWFAKYYPAVGEFVNLYNVSEEEVEI